MSGLALWDGVKLSISDGVIHSQEVLRQRWIRVGLVAAGHGKRVHI